MAGQQDQWLSYMYLCQAAAEKEKGGKKGDKGKERSKSPTKGKAGKKTPEPPSAKGDTKLKKRGEEDQDSKYIGKASDNDNCGVNKKLLNYFSQ